MGKAFIVRYAGPFFRVFKFGRGVSYVATKKKYLNCVKNPILSGAVGQNAPNVGVNNR